MVRDMAEQPADRKTAEATNKTSKAQKGIRKVNLSELKGQLSRRGRTRFADPELAKAILEMFQDGEAFIWEAVELVTDKGEKEYDSSKAKWRARAVSVFESLDLGTDKAISIAWMGDEMVIFPKATA